MWWTVGYPLSSPFYNKNWNLISIIRFCRRSWRNPVNPDKNSWSKEDDQKTQSSCDAWAKLQTCATMVEGKRSHLRHYYYWSWRTHNVAWTENLVGDVKYPLNDGADQLFWTNWAGLKIHKTAVRISSCQQKPLNQLHVSSHGLTNANSTLQIRSKQWVIFQVYI